MNLLRGKMALSMVASMSLVLTTVAFASGGAALASGGATGESRDMVRWAQMPWSLGTR